MNDPHPTKDASSTLPRLAKRSADSNKGDFGRRTVDRRVARDGRSRGVGRDGHRASGAGLVRLAVADSCLDTIAAFEPSLMTSPLACDDEGRIAGAARAKLAELTKPTAATVVACGPGLSARRNSTSSWRGCTRRSRSRPCSMPMPSMRLLPSPTYCGARRPAQCSRLTRASLPGWCKRRRSPSDRCKSHRRSSWLRRFAPSLF